MLTAIALVTMGATQGVLVPPIAAEGVDARLAGLVREKLVGAVGPSACAQAVEAPACESADCWTRLGSETGCAYALTARLSRPGADVALRLRLVALSTGALLAATMNSAPAALDIAALDVPALTASLLASVPGSPPAASRARMETEPAPAPRSATDEAAVDAERSAARKARRGSSPDATRALATERATRIAGLVEAPASADGARLFLTASDWARYERARSRSAAPLTVEAWVDKQNQESMLLNLAWIAPPVIAFMGLASDSDGLTFFGVVLLPAAIVAAAIDLADIGKVTPYAPAR